MKILPLIAALLLALSGSSQPANRPASGNPATKGNSTISGSLGSVTGVPATITLNGKTDLTLTVPKAAGKQHGSMEFKFVPQIAKDSPYRVTIKKIASNMVGAVFNGQGKAPDGVDNVRVCVDYKYELMTRSSDDATYNTFYETMDPAIGGMGPDEGRYVAFISVGAGIDGANGRARQLFLRDRNTGTVKMISRAPDGQPGNADSYAPSISADGKKVVFESNATNLVGDDQNGRKDIFLWDATTNKIERISVGKGGKEADQESFEPMISGNGSFVAFTSSASNLADVPKGESNKNVYLRDLNEGSTTMLSVGMKRMGGDGSKPSISFDGSRVAFHSQSTLIPEDSSPLWDIYLWEKGKAALKRITKTHDGKDKDQGEESSARIVAPAISGNGKYIAYSTTATNIVPGDNNKKQDVFVYEVETGKVTCVSFSDDGKPGTDDSPIEQGDRPSFSYDGTWIAFVTKAPNIGTNPSNIIMHNMITGKKKAVTSETGAYAAKPMLSYSASYVVFGMGAKIDSRHASSGIFAAYTGLGPCRSH